MSQIIRGLVSVTNGSAVVTGDASALFSSGVPAVEVNDLFKVNGEATYYIIQSVDSDTQITLTSNYGGSTDTGLDYTITKDFTVNLNLLRINKGDAELAEILDRNLVLLDQAYGSGLGFSAHKNGTDQTGIVTNTWTKVTFPTELYDDGGYFASDKYTPPAGKRIMSAGVYINSLTEGVLTITALYKNGDAFKYGPMVYSGGSGNICLPASWQDDASGTDYYEIYAYHGQGSDRDIEGDSIKTFFMGM